jgi:hypothetical protein
MYHETEIKYLEFPLLARKLKEYKKQLSDAIWEENKEKIDKLKDKIHSTEVQIALGEVYDIPF